MQTDFYRRLGTVTARHSYAEDGFIGTTFHRFRRQEASTNNVYKSGDQIDDQSRNDLKTSHGAFRRQHRRFCVAIRSTSPREHADRVTQSVRYERDETVQSTDDFYRFVVQRNDQNCPK